MTLPSSSEAKLITFARPLTASANPPVVIACQSPPLSSFEPATLGEIVRLMNNTSKVMSVGSSPPAWLLKRLWSHCTSHLSHYETCPWNLAYFCHCSRKTNLNPDDTSSYRPMSYLPYISKLIERVVTKIFTAHSDTYNLLPVYQSAYMPSHFTETAVPSVHNDLVRAADNGQYCLSFCWTSARLLTL